MKQSKYNYFFRNPEGEGKVLAYNGIRNGLAMIDEEVAKNLEKGNTQFFTSEAGKELAEQLKKGGFLIEDRYDELKLIKFRQQRNQYLIPTLALTLAPTINCNLACHYCFENHTKGKMSDEVIESIVNFSEREITKKGLDHISVTWYGGEPLLYPGIIKKCSEKLIALSKKYKTGYTANIITNGTKLDRETAIMLRECMIRDIQITIDGVKSTHDKRRIYKGGKGSFEQIVNNIEEVVGIIHLTVRINVDKTNVEEADGVFTYFKNMKRYNPKHIAFYYGWVRGYTEEVVGGRTQDIAPEEYHLYHEKFADRLEREGARKGSYPFASAGCVATTAHGFVIGPTGDIWKCWSNIGDPERVIGNVSDGVDVTNHYYLDYMEETWENDQECRDCKALPLCMGGCGDIRIKRNKGELDHKDCGTWRYHTEKKLRNYYTGLARGRAVEAVDA